MNSENSRLVISLVLLCLVFIGIATYAFAQMDIARCQLNSVLVRYERLEQENTRLMQQLNEAKMTPRMVEQFAPYKR